LSENFNKIALIFIELLKRNRAACKKISKKNI